MLICKATKRELQQRDKMGPLAQQQIQRLNETVQRLTEERHDILNQSYLDVSYHEDKVLEKDQTIQSQALKLQAVAADMRALQEQLEHETQTVAELQQQLEGAIQYKYHKLIS